MWPFKRRNKTNDSNVPTEVTDYYSAEHQERRSVAWLLALATFVITLVVALGLFFAGKWIYHRFVNKNESGNQTSQTTDQKQTTTESKKPESGSASTGSQEPQTSSTSTTTPSPAITPTPTQTTPATTPVTGPTTPELIRTGPDEDL